VNLAAAQRALALAMIALLAAIVAVAFNERQLDERDEESALPEPVGTSYRALAGSFAPSAAKRRTKCGYQLTPDLEGISHPVLPCGAKIYISYRGTEVLTQVIDRGPYVPGRQFDLTSALADRLGLHGTQRIRWRFARS